MDGGLGLAALEEIGHGNSKDRHVPEIVVDDLMMLLVDALDSDKDVFDSENEMTSDPHFGKQRWGSGDQNGFSFIDPWRFIDEIYGRLV